MACRAGSHLLSPIVPARLRYLVFLLSASFWLIPGLMMVGALLLAAVSLRLDALPGDWWLDRATSFNVIAPQGARQILSTTATALITVTSLVFSMTLITLTLASSQLGPRLLKMFVRDRVSQTVLGTFTATFLYSLLVLVAVEDPPDTFVPNISITIALVLVVASVALLVYFIHHLAWTIQADSVIAQVGKELDETIRETFGGRRRISPAEELPSPAAPPDALAVCAPIDGYIQAVSTGSLLHLAKRHDVVVKLRHRPGDPVIEGGAIAHVWPARNVNAHFTERVLDAVAIGPSRTPTQDVDFSIKALVEVALRALSPGLNDVFTALACIDRLGASLAHAMAGTPPPHIHTDAEGRVRVVQPILGFAAMLDGAFGPIRQAARGNVTVIVRLIETLTGLAELATLPAARQALREQALMLAATGRQAAALPSERKAVSDSLRQLRAALAEDNHR